MQNMQRSQDYDYGDTPQKAKESQLNMSCVALEQAIDELHKVGKELEQRLRPILRSEPSEAVSPSEQSPTMVPLAAQVDSYVRHVRSIILEQQSILRRLEL